MTPLALLFMVLSWSFVLGLAGWCFHRVLRAKAPGASGATGASGASGASGPAPERHRDRADDHEAGDGWKT